MAKFPLLEMMRAENAQRDARITVPVRQELAMYQAVAVGLRSSLRSLQQFVGREVAKHVIEQVGRDAGRVIREEVHKALLKSGAKPGRSVRVTLDPMDVAMLDERGLERRVLRQYLDAMPSVLSVQAMRDNEATTTVLDIRVPQVGCRVPVADAA